MANGVERSTDSEENSGCILGFLAHLVAGENIESPVQPLPCSFPKGAIGGSALSCERNGEAAVLAKSYKVQACGFRGLRAELSEADSRCRTGRLVARRTRPLETGRLC